MYTGVHNTFFFFFATWLGIIFAASIIFFIWKILQENIEPSAAGVLLGATAAGGISGRAGVMAGRSEAATTGGVLAAGAVGAAADGGCCGGYNGVGSGVGVGLGVAEGGGGVEVGGGGQEVRWSRGGFDAAELEAFELRLKQGGEPDELLARTAQGWCFLLLFFCFLLFWMCWMLDVQYQVCVIRVKVTTFL